MVGMDRLDRLLVPLAVSGPFRALEHDESPANAPESQTTSRRGAEVFISHLWVCFGPLEQGAGGGAISSLGEFDVEHMPAENGEPHLQRFATRSGLGCDVSGLKVRVDAGWTRVADFEGC